MENTKIEWADHTANFWSGCTKVSPGCANCYAESQSARFGTLGKWGPGAPRQQHKAGPEMVRKLNWKQLQSVACADMAGEHPPRRPRIFVNSLSDWLDREVPGEWLAGLLGAINAAPHLDFLLLTKRPHLWRQGIEEACRRMENLGYGARDTADVMLDQWLDGKPPHNVWIGTTVEDQQRADERIPHLLNIPARVRFLSCEPLLSFVDLKFQTNRQAHEDAAGMGLDSAFFSHNGINPDARTGNGINWVIVGGESGHGARPMHPAWARSLRDQCRAAGVPFFFKQHGEWADAGDAHDRAEHGETRADNERILNLAGGHGFHGEKPRVMRRVGKSRAGRMLDSEEWSQFPEVRP